MDTKNAAADKMTQERIRRARSSGPEIITKDATVAEMDAKGNHCVATGNELLGVRPR